MPVLNTEDVTVMQVKIPIEVLEYFQRFKDEDLQKILSEAARAYLKDMIEISFEDDRNHAYAACINFTNGWGCRLFIFVAGVWNTRLLLAGGGSFVVFAERLGEFLREAMTDYIISKYGECEHGKIALIEVTGIPNPFFDV